jgi:hypothetical protein
MDKIKVNLISEPVVKFEFQGQSIEVVPYITLENKIIFYTNYVNSLFENKNDGEFDPISYIEAEYSLILGVVDKCTNVDITSAKIDDIVNSGLWDKIIDRIENYFEVYEDIRGIIARIDHKKSIGNVIDGFANKLNMFLDNLSKMDMSSEGLDKLTHLFKDAQEQVKVINDVVANPVKIPVKRKSHVAKEK